MRDGSVHILIIEDNAGDVRLVQEALRTHGIRYKMTHCETAASGLQKVNSYAEGSQDLPHLMLLDFNLPAGEARDVLAAALRNRALDGMRKAIVTSSVAPKDREQALQCGADCFIFKPAELDAFLTEVGGSIVRLMNNG